MNEKCEKCGRVHSLACEVNYSYTFKMWLCWFCFKKMPEPKIKEE